MLKTISWTLSLSIVLMSPGFNCWAALSETVSGPNAGVDLVPANMNARMQNIGDNSAANFLNVESFEIPAKELGTVPNSISVTPTKVGVQSHKILLDSGLRIAGVTTKADRKPQSGFKATLAHHAAKIMKATQKIRQAVKNHIAGKIANWSNFFDGANLYLKANTDVFSNGAKAEPVLAPNEKVWVTLSRNRFSPSLPASNELEKLFGAKIISEIYSPETNPQSPKALAAAYELVLPAQNYSAFHRHYWMRFSMASERIPDMVSGTMAGIVKRMMISGSMGILISEDGEERVFSFGKIANYRGETAKEMGLKEGTLVRLTLQDGKLKEISIPGFSDKKRDIQERGTRAQDNEADNGSALLSAAIDTAIDQAQTINFIVRNQGVYQSAQDVVRDLKLKTDSSNSAARALGTTAYVINSRAWNQLIPAVRNIIDVAKSLEGKNVQIDAAKWAKLDEVGQAAVQDLKDMSFVSAQIADALSNNKASAQDIEEWNTLSATLLEDSASLTSALRNLYGDPAFKTTPSVSSPLKGIVAGQDGPASDGGIIPVIINDGHVISLRDAHTDKELRRLNLPSFWITFAAAIKGGKEIVIVDSMEDGQAVVLDAQSGKVIRAFKGPGPGLWSRAVSADGRYLFAGQSGRRQAAMWNLETGKREMVFASFMTKILGNFWDALIMRAAMSAALSPDGKIVYIGEHRTAFIGDDEAYVSAWDRSTGKMLARAAVPNADWIHSLSVSQDGRQLYISSENGALITMDAPSLSKNSVESDLSGKIIAAPESVSGALLVNASAPGLKIAAASSPAQNDPAALKSQIDAAISQAQTVSFMIKKMGVYTSVQDVIADLKKDPSSVDAEALNGLLMTAQSAVADTLPLNSAMDQIAAQDLRAPEIQTEISKLRASVQTAIQDMKDMSLAARQIAEALLQNKAADKDAAAWGTLSGDYRTRAFALDLSLENINLKSPASVVSNQKTGPSRLSSSDMGRLIFGVGWLALMIAASHIAPIAVAGVIIGAGVGAALTKKGEDASGNMLVGSLLGMLAGALFAPSVAHAAMISAAPVLSGLKVFGGGVLGAVLGAIIGGVVGVVIALHSDEGGSEAGMGIGIALYAIVGAGIGGVVGAIIGGTLLAALL